MTDPHAFPHSFAIFDARYRLIDWNSGFAEEFADAAPLLTKGISVRDIHTACLLPERALDFSWASYQQQPDAIEYISNRRSVLVTQQLSLTGNVFRFAQVTCSAPQIHPALQNNKTELLRSTALQTSAAVLKHRDQESLRLNELLMTDELTRVANRRSFDERLHKEWQRHKRSLLPLSMIYIDVDFFKEYNDFYGHQLGDDCLKNIASALKANLFRPSDLVARYGGEEFTCILPETDIIGATRIAKKLEAAIRSLAIAHEKSKTAPVITISLGVATAQRVSGNDPSILVTAADQLLYDAKASGRGCVRFAIC